MKMKYILMALALTAGANAATITLSAGFGTGLVPTTSPSYVAVGSYIGFDSTTATPGQLVSNFKLFAGGSVTGKLSGAYTGIDSQFNNQPIYLLVGNGGSLATSTSIAVFQTKSNFVADVTQAGGSIISTANTDFIAATRVGSASGNTVTLAPIAPIPEPSALLLGALGALGLLRRRRI